MSKDFSAAESQKQASVAKPFDHIVELERAESERTDHELKAMEQEKAEILRTARSIEEKTEKKTREEAKAELKKFRENGMQELLEQGHRKGKELCAALDAQYTKEAPGIIADLVEMACGPDSPLLS